MKSWNDFIEQRRKHRREEQQYREEVHNKLKSDDFELV